MVFNTLLATGKILAGYFGKSSAMIADGVHSFSDLVTDVIVIVFVSVSGKDRDQSHPYGHGKFETFATMIISFVLIGIGLGILYTGTIRLMDALLHGIILDKPGMVALYAAGISVLVKESLFWFTIRSGKSLKSQVLVANAWHHRSDVFSSLGTGLGIAGAIFLGEDWRILDPITGIFVSFFILKIGWDLASPSIQELLETALPQETQNRLASIITATEGVLKFHNLKTRKIGDSIAVDVHIKVDRNLTVDLGHAIATRIERKIRSEFGSQSHIGIHVEPLPMEEKPKEFKE